MAITPEILLTTTDYVKKLTNVNESVDDNFLKAAMYIAQDKWVQPYLGDSLMAKLKAGSLSGIYLTLRDEYVAKCIVWWVMVEVTPTLVYKIDNGTMAQRVSEDSQPVSDQIMKDAVNRARDNAQYYTDRLIDYLSANSASIPEYSDNVWPERPPKFNVKGSTVMVIGGSNSASSQPSYFKRISQMP
jgi:hypothetical protein